MHIYPAFPLLQGDRKAGKAPFISLARDWGLMDVVVKAALLPIREVAE